MVPTACSTDSHCLLTARVAKRTKVMFSQACVTSTPGGRWPTPKVTTPPPPRTRSQHLFPPWGPGHNTSLPPWDQVRTPPSRRGPGHNTSLPPGPGHNTYLPPPPRTRSQHLPPSPPRDYVQADGMHPTGMHTCLNIIASRNQDEGAHCTLIICIYCPRSEASEGDVFTGICLSNSGGSASSQNASLVILGRGGSALLAKADPPAPRKAENQPIRSMYASYWNAYL